MPPRRPVPALEDLAADSLADRLWSLGRDDPPPAPALALCALLRLRLPPPLLQQLAGRLPGRGATPLHAATEYLLGGRRARLQLDDLQQVAQLSAPPGGGPRALAVVSTAWGDAAAEPSAAQFGRVLTTFAQLVSLQLTGCATNGLLAAVGSCCRQLAELHVDLAFADDEGVRELLGLADGMEESLRMVRRGVPLSANNMAALRDISFESTMVGVRGNILLLQALPKLHSCRVSEVDLGDVMDGVFGVDPTTRRPMTPCYELRRLESRHPLQTHQTEAIARCCRRLRHVCLRGRCSARNDLMMLNWFTSLSELTSMELIDIHPAALVDFLELVGPRLSSLQLLETCRSGVSLFSGSPSPHLWPALRLCPSLTSLRLVPADPATVAPPRQAMVLSALTQLTLAGAPAVDLALHLCAAAPRLEQLELAGQAVGMTDDTVVSVIADGGLRQLRRLELSQCQLTDTGVETLLAGCEQLHRLVGLPQAFASQLRRRAAANNWSLEVV